MGNQEDTKRILIIDDEQLIVFHLSKLLGDEYDVSYAITGTEGLSKFRNIKPHLVILDMRMPDMDGMEILKGIRAEDGNAFIIVLTGHGNIESAVQAIKLGATDFVTKPITDRKLKKHIEKLFSLNSFPTLETEVRKNIVGDSPEMHKMWKMIETFAASDVTTLLFGETGTGKELIARAIHEMSRYREGPFVPVDCASLPEAILESEIFGYEKGAFTGATARKPGKFELAIGGTIFLDEIANLTLTTQAKLLRVLQERKVYPLGSRKVEPIDLDCRVVSACNTNLKEMIKKGLFREDLYYRLSTVPVVIPPLRNRAGDIEVISKHFVSIFSQSFNKETKGISDDTLAILTQHSFPGNVRELENVIKFGVLAAEDIIKPIHLPEYLSSVEVEQNRAVLSEGSQTAEPFFDDKQEIEISLKVDLSGKIDLKRIASEAAETVKVKVISEIAKTTDLNQVQLAKYLGIDPKTLRDKLKKDTAH